MKQPLVIRNTVNKHLWFFFKSFDWFESKNQCWPPVIKWNSNLELGGVLKNQPCLGTISNLTNIFQMGWKHQAVKIPSEIFRCHDVDCSVARRWFLWKMRAWPFSSCKTQQTRGDLHHWSGFSRWIKNDIKQKINWATEKLEWISMVALVFLNDSLTWICQLLEIPPTPSSRGRVPRGSSHVSHGWLIAKTCYQKGDRGAAPFNSCFWFP